MGSNWQLKEHTEVERPYWEITNGPISLCVNDEDFDDEQKIVQYRLSIVVQRLNDLNVGFHSENALEIKQHIEIMQLRDQAQRMADLLESAVDHSRKVRAELVRIYPEFINKKIDWLDEAEGVLKQFKDATKQVELSCMVCNTMFMGPEPKMCCSGRDCGCMGMPIEPIVCSKECYENLPSKKKDGKGKEVGPKAGETFNPDSTIICKECKTRPAVTDYNGHGFYVCKLCDDSLNREFDNEYQ